MSVKISKRRQKQKEQIDKTQLLSLEQAIEQIIQIEDSRFDETVEMHTRLGVNPKRSDQQIRGNVVLPNGTGKTSKVLVFTSGELVEAAKQAGADYIGDKDTVEEIKKGWQDFDVVIASPDMMRDISKLGPILGPKGLMPNAKLGTVTKDIAYAVNNAKKGQVEVAFDKNAIIHTPIGKKSFGAKKLIENAYEILRFIIKHKPAAVAGRGKFFKTVYICMTQTPALKVDPNYVWDQLQ